MTPHEQALRNVIARIARFNTKDMQTVSLLMLINEDCIKALNIPHKDSSEVVRKIRDLVNEATP